MGFNKRKSEAEQLEQYRVALENAKKQPEINATLSEYGYDDAMITEGVNLYTNTRTAYDLNHTEDDETKEAYSFFTTKKAELEQIFSQHRKKAKVVFRKDNLTAEKLGITGSLPHAYVKWLEKVKRFYSVASEDTAIQSELAKLRISVEDLTAAQTVITELDLARSEYLREKGESQDSTKVKDAAFAEMDDWMTDFYAVARIALEDKPQLLEALGLFVRS